MRKRILMFSVFVVLCGVWGVQGAMAAPMCDANEDGAIDRADVDAILAARGTTTGPGDPRDADGDGQITASDARQCAVQCTTLRCEVGGAAVSGGGGGAAGDGGGAQAIAVTVSAAVTNATEGEMVSVALTIQDLGNGAAPSLGVFDLDVAFDAGVLALDTVTFGDPGLGDQLDLLLLGSITSVTPGAGTVNVTEISLDLPVDLDTLQAPDFVLATLNFQALAPGSSPIGVSIVSLGDSLGAPLVSDVADGVVNVAASPAIPELPPGAALVLAVLLLAAVLHLQGRVARV